MNSRRLADALRKKSTTVFTDMRPNAPLPTQAQGEAAELLRVLACIVEGAPIEAAFGNFTLWSDGEIGQALAAPPDQRSSASSIGNRK